jgi:hypothetical protein
MLRHPASIFVAPADLQAPTGEAAKGNGRRSAALGYFEKFELSSPGNRIGPAQLRAYSAR